MKVLFVCRLNMNRSQIATAIFNRLSKRNHAASAGVVLPHKDEGALLKNAEGHPPIIPMKKMGYDLTKVRRTRLNSQMVKSSDKVIVIFSKKKYWGTLPKYLEKAPGLEWWDVDSISDETPMSEYYRLEKKRIMVIKRYVKDLVKRIG